MPSLTENAPVLHNACHLKCPIYLSKRRPLKHSKRRQKDAQYISVNAIKTPTEKRALLIECIYRLSCELPEQKFECHPMRSARMRDIINQ